MLTEKMVYTLFRKAQAKMSNRPGCFRLPKNWDIYWETKFKPEQREAIRKMTRYMATTWQDIDLERYFECGFELWRGFSYHQWFHKQVINLYIQKSKIHKKVEVDIKKSLVDSAKFVKEYCRDNNIDSLRGYGTERAGFKLICIEHFLRDNISKWFLAFLIHRRYATLTREDWARIEELNENFDEFKRELREVKHFINKLENYF